MKKALQPCQIASLGYQLLAEGQELGKALQSHCHPV